MARPRKHPHEVRSAHLTLRFTPAEADYVRAQADAASVPLRTYLRELALMDQEVVTRRARSRGLSVPAYLVSCLRAASPSAGIADPALIAELNRIGVNLNQLARAVNRGDEFVGTWRALARELHAVLAKVLTDAG